MLHLLFIVISPFVLWILFRIILQYFQTRAAEKLLKQHYLWREHLKSQKEHPLRSSLIRERKDLIFLVTGGCGFMGERVVQYLLKKEPFCKIRVFDIISKKSTDRVEYIKGDLCNKEQVVKACEGVCAVFHIASIVQNYGQADIFIKVNVFGTQNVIDACIECGVEKLMFASSVAALMDRDVEFITEKTPYGKIPTDHYGRTKALAEQSVLEANGVRGLSSCALAFFLVWGPGDKQFYEYCKTNKSTSTLGDGKNIWDPVYVDNVAHAFYCAYKNLNQNSPVAGKKYIITDDNPCTYKEFLSEIVQILHGDNAKVGSIPMVFAWLIAHIFDYANWLLEPVYKFKPVLNHSMLLFTVRQFKFDISAAKTELKYKPIVTRDEGMQACREYAAKHK